MIKTPGLTRVALRAQAIPRLSRFFDILRNCTYHSLAAQKCGALPMPSLRRIFAPVALILLTGLVVWPLRDLFDAFVDSRSFASPVTWMLGMTWGFDFAWSFVLGALLGAVLRSPSAMLWAAAAGIAYGALNFALTEHHFSSSLAWDVYAWIYGQYVVSCVGAVVGAWLATSVLRAAAEKERTPA